MDDTKLKYVRLGRYDEFIIFPLVIEHSTFKHLNPVSAGFCYIDNNKVSCFGESYSLGICGKDDDTQMATKQVFGIDAVYERMLFQLKHNEIDSFYHEWEVKITKDYRITKIKELIKLWETQTNI